jgi:hypothetical protein
MPQASDEIRAPWHGHDEGGDIAAWRFLKSEGWTEVRWILHPNKPTTEITDKEWGAVLYLCDEWDWGYDPS